MNHQLLIACEESGELRRAMRARGVEAYSSDLLPAADNSPHHIQGDVRSLLTYDWAGVIAFPPCDHLCVSGARWFAAKRADGRQQAAIEFFLMFTRLPGPWAIENPIGIMSSLYRKPDQVIQPWQFGHGETKATCLWLNGLPPLRPTRIVPGREARVHRMAPGPDRAKLRARTYPGIAAAMAEQWSPYFSIL